MVEGLRDKFGFIIFDTPPVGAFIDAATLAGYADGTIMVISSGNQEIRLFKSSLEQLQKAGANFLGVVLNKVRLSKASSYYKYGNYYYRGHKDVSAQKAAQRQKSINQENEYFDD